MADVFNIYQICPQCKGRGVIDTTEVTPDPDDEETQVTTKTCPLCEGESEVLWGQMREET